MNTIMIVAGAVLGIVLAIILFWLNKDARHKIKKTWVLIITTVLSLFGFALAIAEDYLSQYDHDPETIFSYEDFKNTGVSFDHLKEGNSTSSPEYLFVLDISGSTRFVPRVELTKSIKKQISAIERTALLNPSVDLKSCFGIDFKNNTIPFYNLLKVRLLYSLSVLRDLNYDEINYKIIFFSEHCYSPPIPNKTLDERLEESFDKVLRIKPDGKYTDFVELFECINYELLQNSTESFYSANSFERKDVIMVFLSDYIHDVKNDNKYETKAAIEKSIKRLEEANVNLKLCMIMDDDSSISSDGRIDQWLQEFLNPSTFRKLDLRGFENVLNYPLMMRNPIPFYYSNSMFEHSLRTSVSFNFDEEKEICFRLGDCSNNNRHQYRLCYRGKKYPLSSSGTILKVHKGDQVYIDILGFVPAPYDAPDIILEDASKGAQYCFPVVFVKNCPQTVFLLIWTTFGMIVTGVFISFIIRNRLKSESAVTETTKKNDDKTSGAEFDISFKIGS